MTDIFHLTNVFPAQYERIEKEINNNKINSVLFSISLKYFALKVGS